MRRTWSAASDARGRSTSRVALACPVAPRREHSRDELGQVRALPGIHEQRKPSAEEILALHPEHAGDLEVRLAGGPAGVEHRVAHRGEVEELGVSLHALLDLEPRAQQLLVLHLQLDLVNLELVQQPPSVLGAA